MTSGFLMGQAPLRGLQAQKEAGRPRVTEYTWRGKGGTGATLVQVLEPLEVHGNAGYQVQLLLELAHSHVAAAVCHSEHLPGLFQQHPHDEDVWGQVGRRARGLRVPDAAPAVGAGPRLRRERPRARGTCPTPAPLPRRGVRAKGAPRRLRRPPSAGARRALRRPPHGPPPGPHGALFPLHAVAARHHRPRPLRPLPDRRAPTVGRRASQ